MRKEESSKLTDVSFTVIATYDGEAITFERYPLTQVEVRGNYYTVKVGYIDSKDGIFRYLFGDVAQMADGNAYGRAYDSVTRKTKLICTDKRQEVSDFLSSVDTKIFPSKGVSGKEYTSYLEEACKRFLELVSSDKPDDKWEEETRTYDVQFDDDTASNRKGWHETYWGCFWYIRHFNGTNESYFQDYKGGTVSIVCNETGETVYEEEVR